MSESHPSRSEACRRGHKMYKPIGGASGPSRRPDDSLGASQSVDLPPRLISPLITPPDIGGGEGGGGGRGLQVKGNAGAGSNR